MRPSHQLPLVSCQLSLTEGLEDIESFRVAAAAAEWTRNEINVAIVRAVYESSYFEDVAKGLLCYCTPESATPSLTIHA